MEPVTRPRRPLLVVISLIAALLATLLASTSGTAAAQETDRASITGGQVVEALRLACAPDFVAGQRGVLCRWSEATNPATRAYRLYRSTDGSARELVTTVRVNGRLGFFDTDVSAPSTLVYGVVSMNRNGRVIGNSGPERVEYGQQVEPLRMACAPDNIGGQRGVLCRWSATTEPTARGYLLYRIVGSDARQVITRTGLDGRLAYFDTEFVPGALHTYGVAAVDGDGSVVAQGGPIQVRWPAAG